MRLKPRISRQAPTVNTAATILPATEAAIAQAAAHLRAGRLVAFPTETVYGLGADATNDRAVAGIFAAKGRPSFNPLIVHVAARAMAEGLVTFNDTARRLADAFWPGPLTLVLPRSVDCPVSLLASAGLDTLAVRMPAHPVARGLITAAGRPLAAPSANPSGQLSPTRAAHVAEGLSGRVAMILDGGACGVGLESSVVAVTDSGAHLLRPGGVPRHEIEKVVALTDGESEPDAPRSPGQLESHYAPRAPLRLDVQNVRADEALLAFGPAPLQGAKETLNLSARGDLVEAAANLFAHLHALDRADISAIAVMPVPRDGLGEAINDRLTRAAKGR
jgi:L-threonylcarbamoyladenylate synthase